MAKADFKKEVKEIDMTKVVFKKEVNPYTKEVQVFAFFPEHPDSNGMYASYAHVGQHSDCTREYADEHPEAEYGDYRPLYDELVALGYDDLEVLNTDWNKQKQKKGNTPECMKDGYSADDFGYSIHISGDFSVTAATPEKALKKMHEMLLNADAAITDGNGNPSEAIVKKYRYWNHENEGDVSFSIHASKNGGDSAYVDIENVRGW